LRRQLRGGRGRRLQKDGWSGKTLTLEKPAVSDANNANVYFDNTPLINAVLSDAHPAGWVVQFPAGDFALSDTILHHYPGRLIDFWFWSERNDIPRSERCSGPR
jgi:hypothetical protein